MSEIEWAIEAKENSVQVKITATKGGRTLVRTVDRARLPDVRQEMRTELGDV